MKKVICVLIFVLFFIHFVSASEANKVAYIIKNPYNIGEEFIKVFNDIGLSVEIIPEESLHNADLSEYRAIFVGNEKFRADIAPLINQHPAIISNKFYAEELMLTTKGGISQLSSNRPLSVLYQNQKIAVYNLPTFTQGGISIPYYYIPLKFNNPLIQTIATTDVGYGEELGSVIAYSNQTPRKCFFGIIYSRFWTPEAKSLFEDCVNYVLGESFEDGEPSESWYCGDDETTENCWSISGGKGTRCYLDEEKETWDYCSSGWVRAA